MSIMEIKDDEIRIIGTHEEEKICENVTSEKACISHKDVTYNNVIHGCLPREMEAESITLEEEHNVKKRKKAINAVLAVVLAVAVMAVAAVLYNLLHTPAEPQPAAQPESPSLKQTGGKTATGTPPYTEIRDTTVHDIPLHIFIPRRAIPEIVTGNIDTSDSTIILGAMAADIGIDRGRWIIAGGFVSKGRLVSHSKSKKGFCAIIGGRMTIGNALNTPYFEKCIAEGGDFFRQYAIVDGNHPVDTAIKNKARRRALCRMGSTFAIIETETSESMDDFADALCTIGVDDAITLMGSGSAIRWATDKKGRRFEIGDMERTYPDVVNYIVWR